MTTNNKTKQKPTVNKSNFPDWMRNDSDVSDVLAISNNAATDEHLAFHASAKSGVEGY